MNEKKLAEQDITFCPISKSGEDLEFLYQVYYSSREEEMALSNWTEAEIENFLRWQFSLQHKQYLENYEGARFDIILYQGERAGRLYVQRQKEEMRIIDIALLSRFRRLGIGSKILKELMKEAYKRNCILSLHVEHNNPALGLYERLGFEKGQLIGVYYYMERPPVPVE